MELGSKASKLVEYYFSEIKLKIPDLEQFIPKKVEKLIFCEKASRDFAENGNSNEANDTLSTESGPTSSKDLHLESWIRIDDFNTPQRPPCQKCF